MDTKRFALTRSACLIIFLKLQVNNKYKVHQESNDTECVARQLATL